MTQFPVLLRPCLLEMGKYLNDSKEVIEDAHDLQVMTRSNANKVSNVINDAFAEHGLNMTFSRYQQWFGGYAKRVDGALGT